MRQDSPSVRIRAFRLRLFPTENGHVALRRAIGVTCVYQSDSSSKRPVAFVAFSTLAPPHQRFCTCGQRQAASTNAPRPAAANSYGAAPRRPALCPAACGEPLPTPPAREPASTSRSVQNPTRTDALGSTIDDSDRVKVMPEQRPRRCRMSKHPSVDKGRSISAQSLWSRCLLLCR